MLRLTGCGVGRDLERQLGPEQGCEFEDRSSINSVNPNSGAKLAFRTKRAGCFRQIEDRLSARPEFEYGLSDAFKRCDFIVEPKENPSFCSSRNFALLPIMT